MGKLSVHITEAATSKCTMQDVKQYLDKTVKEKTKYIEQSTPHASNPSIRTTIIEAEAVKAYAEYLLMAMKSNSPHYLK